ncbi:uncharacterized protein LOC126184659 [Schistocerca cancellata]|uniref:uncharacterized protein LOC126184659 n=1 Tax=Schistocerca cancellata TaxID=274614 RepID=UPI0021188DBE|nr:uncharacterized protein LOC126184659 [Schistocerca cancellata]
MFSGRSLHHKLLPIISAKSPRPAGAGPPSRLLVSRLVSSRPSRLDAVTSVTTPLPPSRGSATGFGSRDDPNVRFGEVGVATMEPRDTNDQQVTAEMRRGRRSFSL